MQMIQLSQLLKIALFPIRTQNIFDTVMKCPLIGVGCGIEVNFSDK